MDLGVDLEKKKRKKNLDQLWLKKMGGSVGNSRYCFYIFTTSEHQVQTRESLNSTKKVTRLKWRGQSQSQVSRTMMEVVIISNGSCIIS